jgi:hypothetical protein
MLLFKIIVLFCVIIIAESIKEEKQEQNGPQKRQTGLELVTFVGVPLMATILRMPPVNLNLRPKIKPTVLNSGCMDIEKEINELLSSPITYSGKGKGCSSNQGSVRTKTSSRVSSTGKLIFLGESSSSMMAPGGDDPRRPPTPPPRNLPLPLIGDRRRKRPRVEGEQPVYVIDDEEEDEEDRHEVEVVTLDDDVFTIDEDGGNEVTLPVQPGMVITLDETISCSSSRGPTSSSSSAGSSGILWCEKERSASETSNGPDEVQFMTRVPALRPYPGTDRNPRGSNQELTPYWRGLIWGTSSSRITNTCVMDSFFSHVIYLARRFPRYFRIHLNLSNDRLEAFILAITQRTEGRTRYNLSQCVHQGWSAAVTPGTFPQVNGVVDMVGSQDEAVFAHLRQSDRIWLIHHCGCQVSTRVDIRKDKHVWTPAQVQALTSPAEENQQESSKHTSKRCKECKSQFRYVRALVSQATWFHAFNVPRTVNSREGYPLSIQMQEIGTNAIVHFDLGYFSYNRRAMVGGVRHYVSVHVIPDQGTLFYDGMSQNGDLQNIPSDLETNSVLESVVYFRRFDEGRPRKK